MILYTLSILLFSFHRFAAGYSLRQYDISDICRNNTQWGRSCTTQILGDEQDVSKCHIETYPSNSNFCKDMAFGAFKSNGHLGGIHLKPYVHRKDSAYSIDRTVLNITFSNIKWKTIRFRFQPKTQQIIENHCRDIKISNNVKINDRSLLYYDCYWPITDENYAGQSHILDFEASDDDSIINRGRYYFNVPSSKMLSPTITEKEWVPFVYIEVMNKMRLHIVPPPSQLNVTGYRIKFMKESNRETSVHEDFVVKLVNNTEVTYDYSLFYNGTYYFVVTPLHAFCMDGEGAGCRSVESPTISQTDEVLTLCMASIAAVVVTSLFACFVAMYLIRKYCCKDYRLANNREMVPLSPKILVVYPSENHLFSQCVFSFVMHLRNDRGLDVMYDGDIGPQENVAVWAQKVYEKATHILYMVPPAKESNITNNLYDQPIRTASNGIDKVFMSYLRNDRHKNDKVVLNIQFEHFSSPLPFETKDDIVYKLIKDYKALIGHLSENLLPKDEIKIWKSGQCFLADLNRANKLLGEHNAEKKQKVLC